MVRREPNARGDAASELEPRSEHSPSLARAVSISVALVVSAATLTWAHLAVAALTVCLNESPALAADMAVSVPVSSSVAGELLPLFAPFGVSTTASPPTCDPAAPARAMAIAGVAYVLAIVALDRGRVSGRLAWSLVIGVAALVRLTLFFMPGLLSSDIIDYATHGRVASLHGANPYVATPSQFPSDPLSSLGAWPTVVTVYGPLWTRIDAAVTGVSGTAASLVQLVFAYKLIALLADLASVLLIAWLAVRWRRLGVSAVTPLVVVAMWLWNPLVNVELIGNAHNESLMIALILGGLAFVTFALSAPWGPRLWLAALLTLWLGAMVKFVPLAYAAIVALVCLRSGARGTASVESPGYVPATRDCTPVRSPSESGGAAAAMDTSVPRAWQVALLVVVLAAASLVVSAPWLDSPAVAAPVIGVASGGQRFKDVWQDAPAAWLTVRVVPLLGVPDDPATLRMDVARVMVYSLTRALFVAYLLVEAWRLWRVSIRASAEVLRAIATSSMRVLLLALLLYTSQVYAWYFLWPLPAACLLGPRNFWSQAVMVFGLTFLPAFYLREFQPYGVFEMPRYAEIALAILAAVWLATRVAGSTRTRDLSSAPVHESVTAARP